MSLLDEALGGKLIRIRGGEEIEIAGFVNGNMLTAEINSDVRYQDVIRDEYGAQFVVQSCERNKSPSDKLDYLSAKVIPYEEWTATQKDWEPQMTITQHIGSAHAVAGRDISGDITINVTPEKLAEKLEELIMSLPLPEAEKKSVWSKIGSAIGDIGAGVAKAFVAGLLK